MHERCFKAIDSAWLALAAELARQDPNLPAETLGDAACRIVQRRVFLQMCRQRDANAPDWDAPPNSESNLGWLARDIEQHAAIASWPVDALGWIHERLLGRRLVRVDDGSIRIEEHKRTRKVAGVFYTPSYVCEYMAQKALAETEDRRPRILDPACGCGAFLLAAYRHLRRHAAADPEAFAAGLHGVDIDPQAVLVARRSLWLEAQSERLSDGMAQRLAERLTANLRTGDVLVDPAVEALGPFDVVLGNPPYRRELHTKALLDRIAATEFGRRYRTPRMDLWYYFFHRGLELLKPGGRLSFIVGAYWTKGRGAERLIAAMREDSHVEELFALGRLQVFPGVAGQHLILTLTKGPSSRPTLVKTVNRRTQADAEPFVRGVAPVVAFEKTAEQLFRGGIDLEPPCGELLARLERFPPLASFGLVRQGIAENPAAVTERTNLKHGSRWTVGEGVFVLTEAELAGLKLTEAERGLLRPYHDLCDLGRYTVARRPSRWLIYSTPQTCPAIDPYPGLRRHLERFRPILDERRETRQGRRAWWQLHWPRDESLWQASKLLAVQMAPRPAFAPALTPVYVPFSVNVFIPDAATREHLYYLAAVLNSRLLWKWFRHHAKQRGVGLEINGHVLARAPIHPIDFTSPAEVACHDRLVALVDAMLASGSVEETDREIDQRVYELYGLTEAEIRDVQRE
jgi:adenine-specific DNA-methyltransferase